MANIQDQITQARSAGYSDEDIAAHLSKSSEYGSKMQTALNAGYKPSEILAHLAPTPKLTGVDAIPGQRSISKSEPEPSLLDKIRGAIEVVPALASGAVSGVVTPIAQLGHELLGGQAFTPEGKKAAAEFGKKVQAEFYQPRTATGQQYTQAVGSALEPLTAVMPMNGLLADVGRATSPAVRAATDVARSEANLVKGAVAAPFEARTAAKQAKNVAESYKNATKIEAAQAANNLGIALNPAESNPTTGNKVRSVLTGNKDVNASLAAANEGKWQEIVKQDLGVPAEGELNTQAIETALDKASKPYDVIREMDSLETPPEAISALESLRKQATIGGEGKTSQINSLVNDALAKLQKTTLGPFTGIGGEAVKVGRSGSMILDDIRSMRRDAQAIYKAQSVNPDPLAIAKADTQMSIARILEDVIDANAPTPQVLAEFRAARQRMAQIYDHERAIDYSTNKVDPQVYAKLLDERKGNMTGVGADIGKVAANFPEVSKVGGTATPAWQQGLTRSGVAGTLGYAAGTVLGTPIAGAVTGAVVGKLASSVAAKRMATPGYQAAHAVPTDYRPVNNLRPAELNYGPNQLVPYDFSQQVITPDQIPNWTFGRNEVPPKVTPAGAPPGPAQIPMSQGPVGGQTGALRAEDARLYQQQAAAEAQAQAAAEAQAAAARQPARGGVQFDLDPVTGKLVPTSSTLKGATPNTQVIESTGHSITSAVDKIVKGQAFALTPEERIAWNRTKVEVVEVLPELRGLTDKAISSKIMDRQWVADTITKLREQDRAFNMLAERSKANQHMADAAKKRELLLDQLIALEERLRPGRPVSTGGQGPKTRAAKNRLILTPEDINSLAP